MFLGLAAVGIIIFGSQRTSSGGAWVWLLAARAVPAIYALNYTLIATRQPAYLDLGASPGIMMAISAVTTFPIVFLPNDFTMAGSHAGNAQLILVIILMNAMPVTNIWLQTLRARFYTGWVRSRSANAARHCLFWIYK